mgnify:CR=1 FL=1
MVRLVAALRRAKVADPLLLLDEVAGGLTEGECAELVALIKSIRAQGISIIWIEHIVHALAAVVERLVVLAGGLGTRIAEESHLKPEPMIEIGGKPILWKVPKRIFTLLVIMIEVNVVPSRLGFLNVSALIRGHGLCNEFLLVLHEKMLQLLRLDWQT